jgi:putative membrane protein insertion efficiency factor
MTSQTTKNTVLIEHFGFMRSLRAAPKRCLVALIRLYQLAVSPALAPACRYLPSCSEYAAEAIDVHGAVRGSWLAVRRLLRCHPFHAGGHDPVPPRVARSDGLVTPGIAVSESEALPATGLRADFAVPSRLAGKE